MAHGMYDNVGFRIAGNEEMELHARQIMDCLFPEPGYYGVDSYILDNFPSCDWSRKDSWLNPEELFHLLNALFGPTYVYAEEGEFTTVSDYYDRTERIYDPVRMIEQYAHSVDDYGGSEMFGVDWEEVRERLLDENLYQPLTEAMLDAGFELDEDYDCIDELMENYDDDPTLIFDDLECKQGDARRDALLRVMEILDGYDIDGGGSVREEEELPLEVKAVPQETIDRLLQTVIEKGQAELAALILEKGRKE